MAERLRVVIAEDNYLVREGTRRLLEDSGAVEVVAAVGDGTELRDAVRRLSPDAVLTDIRMPPGHHMEGIDAAHAIRAAHPASASPSSRSTPSPPHAFALLQGARPAWRTCSRTASATSTSWSGRCARCRRAGR
jgi:DNA-binding NarL/FixJ family response regulator